MLRGIIICILFMAVNSQASIDGATNPVSDDGLPYKFESNQHDLYRQAFEKAKSENKLLIVILGRNDCGWCTRLEKTLESPSMTAQLKSRYEFQNIATFVRRAVPDGNRTHFKIDSGIEVEAQLAELAGMKAENIKGAPYLFIIDPNGSGKPKAVGFDSNPFLASLEIDGKTTWYIDEAQLTKSIADAALKLGCSSGLL